MSHFWEATASWRTKGSLPERPERGGEERHLDELEAVFISNDHYLVKAHLAWFLQW